MNHSTAIQKHAACRQILFGYSGFLHQ